MPLDPRDLDLPVLVSLTGAAYDAHLLARLRGEGFTALRASHGYVFQHLIEGSPTVGELAERLGVTPQAASKAVVELEELGYVERRADATDSRVRRVALTDLGHRAVRAGRKARKAFEKRVRAEVGEKATKAAREVLLAMLREAGGWEAVTRRSARPPDP